MVWIITKMLLKVLILAPFFSIWFLVDTVIGFMRDGLEESISSQRDYNSIDIKI